MANFSMKNTHPKKLKLKYFSPKNSLPKKKKSFMKTPINAK
jgi:hypothetical protein